MILTAAHVLTSSQTVFVTDSGGHHAPVSVLTRDAELDVAVLEDWPAATHALELAVDARDHIGESIVTAGYVSGWTGRQALVGRGTLAGVDVETWIEAAGSWGASGAPVVSHDGNVVALIRANAGHPHEDLDKARAAAQVIVGELDDALAPRRELLDAFASAPSLVENVALSHTRIKNLVIRETVESSRLSLLVEQRAFRELIALADLLKEHFRTGFLRVVPCSELRRLLGPV